MPRVSLRRLLLWSLLGPLLIWAAWVVIERRYVPHPVIHERVVDGEWREVER